MLDMMRLSQQFINRPVLSIHAGHTIGRVVQPIVNPHNLSIIGFYCQSLRSPESLILLPQNIRETSKEGFVINHEEDLAESDELVRLKEVLDLAYELRGKAVVTESGKKLGKVSDYIIDDIGWKVVKIHISRPAWKAVFESALIIDRAQIVSVSKRAVVVKDASVKSDKRVPAAVPSPAA